MCLDDDPLCSIFVGIYRCLFVWDFSLVFCRAQETWLAFLRLSDAFGHLILCFGGATEEDRDNE